MKKSVVILIAIIYIAAIALVSFFGLKHKLFNEEVYVSDITILDDNLKNNATWGDYVIIHRDADTGRLEYRINYRVTPAEATNTGVNFTYDKSKADSLGITVDDTGLVSFTSGGAGMFIKIIMVPADGSDVEKSITIVALE